MTHLQDHPLSLLVTDEVTSSAFSFDRSTAHFRGTLYDRRGMRIDQGIRLGGFGGDRIINEDPQNFTHLSGPVERYEGTTIYLGNLMAQYGHFLTEGLSTLWALEHVRFDRALFHPFLFGDDVPSFMAECHQHLGLKDDSVVVTRKSCWFERIIVPERTIILNKSAHVEHRRTLRRLLKSFVGEIRPSPDRQVFLSRSRLHDDKRGILNAALIDELMAKLGFDVVHPQEVPLTEQIALFNRARVLVGFSGSALHNCLFQQVGAKLIEIGDHRSPVRPHPMQEICNELAEVDAHYIKFFPAENRVVNVPMLEKSLLSLL